MKYNYIFITSVFLITFPNNSNTPENYNATHEINELTEKTSHEYKPNPVILDGVNQIMNGAISIAQNPHSRPNLGLSIVAMIHGILKIIIEKIAHKKNIKALNQELLSEYNELGEEIIEEILKTIDSFSNN